MGTAKEIAEGVIIGVFVYIVLLGLPTLATFLGLNFPYDVLQLEVPLWITILAIIIIIPTVALGSRRRRRGGAGYFRAVRRRPESDVVNLVYGYGGVNWRVLFGRATPFRDTEPFAFCSTRPYCPECNYEMEAEQRGLLKRYYWRCDRCGKSYRCPVNPRDADGIVERMVEADFRNGKLEYPH